MASRVKQHKESRGMKSSSERKVGLGLSGGGFRASFFHLGVLARLAEVDALRDVQVLSSVSGGSIVGAHFPGSQAPAWEPGREAPASRNSSARRNLETPQSRADEVKRTPPT